METRYSVQTMYSSGFEKRLECYAETVFWVDIVSSEVATLHKHPWKKDLVVGQYATCCKIGNVLR